MERSRPAWLEDSTFKVAPLLDDLPRGELNELLPSMFDMPQLTSEPCDTATCMTQRPSLNVESDAGDTAGLELHIDVCRAVAVVEDDVPIIPCLEDEEYDEFQSKVAVPPVTVVLDIAGCQDIIADLLNKVAFNQFGPKDVDMNQLSNKMSLLDAIYENDEAWAWPQLFTEVSSELRQEHEKKELEEELEQGLAEKYSNTGLLIGEMCYHSV